MVGNAHGVHIDAATKWIAIVLLFGAILGCWSIYAYRIAGVAYTPSLTHICALSRVFCWNRGWWWIGWYDALSAVGDAWKHTVAVTKIQRRRLRWLTRNGLERAYLGCTCTCVCALEIWFKFSGAEDWSGIDLCKPTLMS